jgi:hypothetical protein
VPRLCDLILSNFSKKKNNSWHCGSLEYVPEIAAPLEGARSPRGLLDGRRTVVDVRQEDLLLAAVAQQQTLERVVGATGAAGDHAQPLQAVVRLGALAQELAGAAVLAQNGERVGDARRALGRRRVRLGSGGRGGRRRREARVAQRGRVAAARAALEVRGRRLVGAAETADAQPDGRPQTVQTAHPLRTAKRRRRLRMALAAARLFDLLVTF